MFYFIHQIKLETIPYVEKQILSFTKYFQQHLNKKDQQQINIHEDNQWNKTTQKLLKIMQKKYQQIQLFHYNNWMDYRASLILRSKKILTHFYQNNQQLLNQFNEKQQTNQQKFNTPQRIIDSNSCLISEFKTNSQQKEMPFQQNINQKIKLSVKRIKTQMADKPIKQKQKTSKISLKQNKKQTKTNLNLSKDQITKQVNKIIQKQKVKQKSQNNSLVFSSRRKQQPKKQLKIKQKIVEQQITHEKDKKIIKKFINDSKQKTVSKTKSKNKLITTNKLTQRLNLTKKQDAKLTKSVEKVKQTANKNTNKVKQTPVKVKIGNKKMTKQEYVEYLINKNKQQNKNKNVF